MDEDNTTPNQPKATNVEPPKVVDPRPTAPEPNVEQSPADVTRMDDPAPTLSAAQHNTVKSKSKLLWGGVAAIVVLLFAAGVYAFIQYNQPQNRIKRALVSGLNQDQIAATLGLDVDVPEEGVTTQLNGRVQLGEDAGYFSLGVESFEAGAIALSSNFQPEAEFVALLDDEDVIDEAYFKLSGIDKTVVDQYLGALGSQSQPFDDLYNTYHDQWIDISQQIEDLEEGEEQAPDLTLSDSDREKLTDIIKDSNLVIIDEELERKDINGDSADGFVVSPDFDGIVLMLEAVRDAELEIVDELNDIDESEIDFDVLIEGVEEAKEDYDDSSDDLEIQFWLDGDEFAQMVFRFENPEGDFEIVVTTAEYDESLIEVPEESLPFSDLQEDFTSALFGGSAFAPNPSLGPDPAFPQQPSSDIDFDAINLQ